MPIILLIAAGRGRPGLPSLAPCGEPTSDGEDTSTLRIIQEDKPGIYRRDRLSLPFRVSRFGYSYRASGTEDCKSAQLRRAYIVAFYPDTICRSGTLHDHRWKRTGLSLTRHRRRDGKYRPQRDRVAGAGASLSSGEITDLVGAITNITVNHSTLIDRLFHTRNTRIAHATTWSGGFDPKTFQVRRFPKMRCYRFANDLRLIFLGLAFGFDLSRTTMQPPPTSWQ